MTIPNRSSRRSDEIRRRRMMQSHTGRQSAARQPAAHKNRGTLLGKAPVKKDIRRRAAVTRTPPPVLARGVSSGSGRAMGRGGGVARRTHRLTLGAPGAEMNLPALPRFGFSWRIASFALLALLGAALYYMWTAPEFRVQVAQVSGLKRLTRGEVNRELALRDQPVFTLDATSLEGKLLEAFPELSSAQVTIDLPNTVLITVTERTPVLIWHQEDRTILVDSDGKTFQARDQIARGSLPVVEAASDPPPASGTLTLLEEEMSAEEVEAKKAAMEVVQEFQPTTLFERSTLEAILKLSTQLPPAAVMIYHPVHGFGWQDARGWPVFFGDLSDLEVKLSAYRVLVEKIRASGGKPELISLQFVRAPYYRLAKQDEGQ